MHQKGQQKSLGTKETVWKSTDTAAIGGQGANSMWKFNWLFPTTLNAQKVMPKVLWICADILTTYEWKSTVHIKSYTRSKS